MHETQISSNKQTNEEMNILRKQEPHFTHTSTYFCLRHSK
jgi:hypothetical protein